jgi:hypothetical protein
MPARTQPYDPGALGRRAGQHKDQTLSHVNGTHDGSNDARLMVSTSAITQVPGSLWTNLPTTRIRSRKPIVTSGSKAEFSRNAGSQIQLSPGQAQTPGTATHSNTIAIQYSRQHFFRQLFDLKRPAYVKTFGASLALSARRTSFGNYQAQRAGDATILARKGSQGGSVLLEDPAALQTEPFDVVSRLAGPWH